MTDHQPPQNGASRIVVMALIAALAFMGGLVMSSLGLWRTSVSHDDLRRFLQDERDSRADIVRRLESFDNRQRLISERITALEARMEGPSP